MLEFPFLLRKAMLYNLVQFYLTAVFKDLLHFLDIPITEIQ